MAETSIQELQEAVESKKAQLDGLRPLPAEALSRLEHYYDVEITYASNAIEGNTLSAVETTLVIEKGVTIGGKPLKDHLEALDHYDAMRYMRELARGKALFTERCPKPSPPGDAAVAARYRRPVCGPAALRSDGNRAF